MSQLTFLFSNWMNTLKATQIISMNKILIFIMKIIIQAGLYLSSKLNSTILVKFGKRKIRRLKAKIVIVIQN